MNLKITVGGMALLGLATGVWAQSAGVEQRIEITGSSIKRIASEGALPVQTISRQELERQGISSAEQLVMHLNINGNGVDNLASNSDVAAGSSRGNNGLSAANLRMQGANATLVLLNGRRVAIAGLSGGVVDLQQIPFAAIERIEVLKDGASSLYGTDAIGGVINFITRKDYSGLQVQAFADIDQHAGGNIAKGSVTAGFGNLDTDRFNVLATLSYSDSKALRGDQRDFVNTFQSNRGLSPDTRGTPYATVFAISSLYNGLSRDNINATGRSTGPVFPGGGTQTYNGINSLNLPGGAGCGTVSGQGAYDYVLWASPGAKYGCAWDTGKAAALQQPVQNTNLFARGTLRLGEHELFAEVVGAEVKTQKSFSPQQISSSTSGTSPFLNLAYPSTGAAYAGVYNALVGTFPTLAANNGRPLSLRWRCMPCGNREIGTTSDTGRIVVGAEGPLGLGGWDYKLGLSTSYSDAKSRLDGGYYFGAPLAALINTGTLNPFSIDGSQTTAAMSGLAAASATGTTLYGGKTTMTEVDATVTGTVTKLPAGDMQAAVGVDFRTEKYRFNGNEVDLLTQNSIPSAPFDSVNSLDTVKRDTKAVFAELLVPITKALELTLSVRRDDYTGFGASTNPKVALRFTATDELLFRGSYSTGFRVPTFAQEFFGVTLTQYTGANLVDPATCPTLAVSSAPGCASITPVIATGGKPELGPEKSKQGNLGVVWAPNSQFSANLDWWSIKRTGTIQTFDLTTLTANYASFQGAFIRDPSGAVQLIDDRWINAGGTITKGIELGFKANGKVFDGRWAVNYDLAYLLEKASRPLPTGPWSTSEVAVATRTGDIGLRWKHTLEATYAQGNWSGSLGQVWRSGYADFVLPGVANGSVTPPDWNPRVKEYVTYNTSISYMGIKGLTLTAGIKNLLDTKPPFSATYDTNTGAGSSWEPRVADPRLRSFTFLVDYKFF
jgi:iron complex outermembrane receptor protein